MYVVKRLLQINILVTNLATVKNVRIIKKPSNYKSIFS